MTIRQTSSVRKSRTVRSTRSAPGDAGRRRLGGDAIVNLLPFVQQQGEVADEVALLLAFSHRADDHAIPSGMLNSRRIFFSGGVPLILILREMPL